MPTALITGGHLGIGFECAKQLASGSAYSLVLAGRNMDVLEATAQELRTECRADVSTLTLDTSSLRSVRDAAKKFRAMLDSGEAASLEALLCNAGGYFSGSPPTARMVMKKRSRPIASDIFFSSSSSPTEWKKTDVSSSLQAERMILL